MTALVRYEAARQALAEAKAVDEVKDLHDKAAAMQAYQRMAGDKSLEIDAAEIRIRAERRLGELIAAQKRDHGLNQGARAQGNKEGAGKAQPAVVADDRRLKLADVGVSKDLSSRAQKLAAVPEPQFEAEIGEWRERVQAEGARVTSRLVTAGEQAIKDQAADSKPKPRPAGIADAARALLELLRAAEPDTLTDDEHAALADLAGHVGRLVGDEMEDRIQALADDNDRLERENADLRMAAGPQAAAEMLALTEKLRTIEMLRNDLMETNASLNDENRKLKNQIRRADRAA